jgi:UDP-3-O-[3-hydroxymyristoyl] glucosamine N-acyltransferase
MTSFPRALPQPFDAASLVEIVGGVERVSNLENVVVSSVAAPQTAEQGSLIFMKARNAEDLQKLVETSKASVIVVGHDVAGAPGTGLIVVSDPLAWFIRALGVLLPLNAASGVNSSAQIDASSKIGRDVEIGANTVIEADCRVGDGTRIGANCFIGSGTVIGAGTFIQSNVSIGGVGLGYHVTSEGERLFFPHLGAVLIGDDVVIGTGSVIVRGQLTDTIVADGVRLGNLVNIGHNVSIGKECVLSSSTCVAGGARLGAGCNIGAGVAINAKIALGDGCQVGLGSVVVKDVATNVSVFGNPAQPLRTMRRF